MALLTFQCAQDHLAGWRDGEQTDVHAEMAALARSWTVRTDPGFRPAVQYRVTLRPAAGLPVIVRSRS